MAKNYDEMDTEELKALAEERKQRQAALNQLARSDPSAMKAMTANERQDFLKDQEKQRRDEWHQELHDARERRLDGMRQIAARDHGRYSPEVFAPTLSNGARAALAYLERQENRPERIREFDETQKTERIKASEHANGLINQGKTQAEIKAAAEREMSRNRDGWWDDQGNFHSGASVRAAEATGQAKIGVEEKKNEGKVAVEDKKTERTGIVEGNKNQRSTEHNQTLENIANTHANANVEAARERQRRIDERRAQQDALAEQRDFEKFKKDINNLMNTQFSSEERMKFNAMKPEEQKAFWKDYQGRQQEQQLPKVEGYTPERVAELIKRGYKVVDGKFVK